MGRGAARQHKGARVPQTHSLRKTARGCNLSWHLTSKGGPCCAAGLLTKGTGSGLLPGQGAFRGKGWARREGREGAFSAPVHMRISESASGVVCTHTWEKKMLGCGRVAAQAPARPNACAQCVGRGVEGTGRGEGGGRETAAHSLMPPAARIAQERGGKGTAAAAGRSQKRCGVQRAAPGARGGACGGGMRCAGRREGLPSASSRQEVRCLGVRCCPRPAGCWYVHKSGGAGA